MIFQRRHLRRLWSAVRRTPSDEDFARELRFHLDQAEAELRGRGYSRADARRVVRTRSGGFFQALEALRTQRGLGRTMDLWDDVRYAVRRLMKARRFTVAASTALALGIGANTMVFTMVNAILIRNLPFDDPDRIVAVWTGNPEGQRQAVSYPDYEDWRDQTSTLAGLSAYTNSIVNVSDDEQVPDRVFGAYVSPNFFRLLGEQPVLGRDFGPDDDRHGAEPVVLLGYGLWETRYGRDAGVLGRTIRVNALPATVVGVMAPGMRFPNDTDIWIPRMSLPPESNVPDRGTRSFAVIGRLGPGASVDQARQELRAIGSRLAEAYPDTNRDRAPDLVDYLDFVTRGEPALLTLTLMGAVAFVLLIACANVANLLLARATGRRREIAVRVALGATRPQIVRQLLIESLVLALVAGAVGFLLSILGIRWISSVTRSAAIGMPYWIEFTLDGTVFAFTAALCLVTAVAFGLVPALRVSGTDVTGILKEATPGSLGGVRARRWAGALVVGQLVLSLVLLSGAGFMIRSFLALQAMEEGFETSDLIATRLFLPVEQYPEADGRGDLLREFEDRLRLIPALRGQAIASVPPLYGGTLRPLEIEDRMAGEGVTLPVTTVVSVSDGYFDALRIALTRGRSFRRGDGIEGSEVAIVNERFVEMHLDGEPLGQQIRLPVEGGGAEGPWLTVIGVSPSIRQRQVEESQPDPVVYLPLRANPPRFSVILVRSPADPARVIPELQEAMRAIDPDLPLYNATTMEQLMADYRIAPRVFVLMLSVFAGIALTISVVGVYSVAALSVAKRTREIGLRVALGAGQRQTSWLFLRRSLGYLAIGLPAGTLGALGVGQMLRSVLVQIRPADPVTLAGTVLLLTVVCIAAGLIPARRAARLDPMVALRAE